MSQNMATILSMRALRKRFGDVVAVDDVSLDIRAGEFFTIVGPSGSGKSTLIRMLAGLEVPTSGTVSLRGADITDVPANRRPTCMVFQSLALFRHKTVGENIAFSLKMKGMPSEERRRRAIEMMGVVRLPEDYFARPVTQCSGGEQQRVALARALASDPDILFFDEPLSAIDYRLRKILEVEMKDIHRRTGKTTTRIAIRCRIHGRGQYLHRARRPYHRNRHRGPGRGQRPSRRQARVSEKTRRRQQG
jgi:spermidine/putrescine transport system ATP-binding protein